MAVSVIDGGALEQIRQCSMKLCTLPLGLRLLLSLCACGVVARVVHGNTAAHDGVMGDGVEDDVQSMASPETK